MNVRTKAIYIKPMTWLGKLSFYVGQEPSDPTADLCCRLGQYFIRVDTMFSAKAIADHEARRTGSVVIVCPHYVGQERSFGNKQELRK